MKPQTQQWLDMAHYDLRAAKHNFDTRTYLYVIFLCHLTIEKLLKGCITEFTEDFPPPIHDLNKLVRLAKLALPDELARFVSEMSQKSVPARYPQTLNAYSRKDAEDCLKQTRRVAKWLEAKLKSNAL
jgi:HEPN domain-containing protein